MQKIRFLPFFLCLITSLSSVVYSATVNGTVYDESVSPVKGAIVQVYKGQFSTMLYSQVMTGQSGSYSFSLPAGSYTITAAARIEKDELETSVNINLSEDDRIVIDFVLLPNVGSDVPDIVIPATEEEFPLIVEEAPSVGVGTAALIIVIVLLAILTTYFIWRRQSEQSAYRVAARQVEEIKREIEELKAKKEEPPLGRYLTDEERVYQIVRRMKEVPQKHIVTETGFSKAKVTMLLKKLEKLGKIKRVISGREKIVKAVD